MIAIAPIALALAQFVPGVLKLFGSERASEIADTVIKVAQTATGTTSPEDALDVLKKDPVKALEFQTAMMSHEKAWWEQESKRLAEINTTIRAELTSGDAYVRRMRPTWGYAMCVAFTTQMLAVTYSIIFEPQYTAEIVTALASLSVIWSVGLSVLGIYVWKRSDEKANAAGNPKRTRPLGAGLLDAVGALRGGK